MDSVNLWGLIAVLVVVAGVAIIGAIRESRKRDEAELRAALDRVYPMQSTAIDRRGLASAAAKMQTRDENGRFASGRPGPDGPAARNAE